MHTLKGCIGCNCCSGAVFHSCKNSVKMRCHELQVDEEGTEAAAVTAVVIASFGFQQHP